MCFLDNQPINNNQTKYNRVMLKQNIIQNNVIAIRRQFLTKIFEPFTFPRYT